MPFRPPKAVLKVFSFTLLTLLIVSSVNAQTPAEQSKIGKLFEFGRLRAEDGMARLDLLATELHSRPNLHGFIVARNSYDLGSGWLLREAHGYLDYLVNKRGIPESRLKVVEAEPQREPAFELWLLPAGSALPADPRLREPEPKTPQRFDTIYLGDEGECVGELLLHLYKLEDSLRIFAGVLSEQPGAKAWVVIYPRTSESLVAAKRTVERSRQILLHDYDINSERVLTAIGSRRSSICTHVNLWIVPSNSTKTGEAAHYAELMKEAEQAEYTVRRVAFAGNTYTRDHILRQRFMQKEGEGFSLKLLDQSLKNFDRLGILYPVSLNDVEVDLDRGGKFIDLKIFFRERSRARSRSKL